MDKRILLVVLGVTLLLGSFAGIYVAMGDDDESLRIGADEAGSKSISDEESDRHSPRGERQERKASRVRGNNDASSKESNDNAQAPDGSDPTNPDDVADGEVNPDGTVKGSQPDVTSPNSAKGASAVQPVSRRKTAQDVAADRRDRYGRLPLEKALTAKDGSAINYAREASFESGEKNEEGLYEEGSRVVQTHRAASRRITGATRKGSEKYLDGFSRLIHGVVFEVKSGRRYPLADALVTDLGDKHRAYTDANGRFEFVAYYTDLGQKISAPRDSDPKNDRWTLLARVDGYRMAHQNNYATRRAGQMNHIGQYYFDEDAKSAEGAQIELVWHGSDTVRTRLMNPPQDASGILIRAESYNDANSARNGDNFVLESYADAKGEATFTFPPRKNLKITASGEGFQVSSTAQWNKEDMVWEITLQNSDTIWLSGTVVDFRTREPLLGVRLYKGATPQQSAYTDSEGKFGAWFTPTKLGEKTVLSVSFELDGYGKVSENMYASTQGRVKIESGGASPSGPWEVTLRPLVRVSGAINLSTGEPMAQGQGASFLESGTRWAFSVYDAKDGTGKLMDAELPWGIGYLKFTQPSIDDSGNQRTMTFHILFPESFWTEIDVYVSTFTAERR